MIVGWEFFDFLFKTILKDPDMKNAVDKIDMNKLLNDVETLENIGVDISFISDIRKLYKLQTVPETLQVFFHDY